MSAAYKQPYRNGHRYRKHDGRIAQIRYRNPIHGNSKRYTVRRENIEPAASKLLRGDSGVRELGIELVN